MQSRILLGIVTVITIAVIFGAFNIAGRGGERNQEPAKTTVQEIDIAAPTNQDRVKCLRDTASKIATPDNLTDEATVWAEIAVVCTNSGGTRDQAKAAFLKTYPSQDGVSVECADQWWQQSSEADQKAVLAGWYVGRRLADQGFMDDDLIAEANAQVSPSSVAAFQSLAEMCIS